jgi:hypothetical protein
VPYEVVVVTSLNTSPESANIWAYQAGPNDEVPAIPCPPPNGSDPAYADLQYRVVNVIGAPSASFAGFGQDGGIDAASGEVLLSAGPSDVVAFAPSDSPVQYLLERNATLTQDALLLDFASYGHPLEVRPIVLQGLAPGQLLFDFSLHVTTSGRVALARSPLDHSHPRSLAMIPASGLSSGDQENVTGMVVRSDVDYSRSEIDLRSAKAGPLTMEFLPPLDSVVVSPSPIDVDISVSASWAWNEQEAGLWRGMGGPDGLDPQQTWMFTTAPGWPDRSFKFTGMTIIPGWQSAWRLTPGRWSVMVCDKHGATRNCASRTVTTI